MWQPQNKKSSETDWVEAAAKLPIAFAQVREDPAIDIELLRGLDREARVVMIASGGETAAMLATLPIAELQLVDVNQSQLNLTRLKLQLLASADRGERLRLLGHLPMDADKRSGELARRLAELQLPADALGTPALVARHGPDHCGRYEWLFARMRECLLDQSDSVRQLMMLSEVDAQAAMIAPDTALARHLKAAYDHVMDLPRLARIFGPDATANRQQSFADHFFARTCQALRSAPAAGNPFLHQIYLGEFPGPCWPWLEQPVAELTVRPRFVRAGMDRVLASLAEGSRDLGPVYTMLAVLLCPKLRQSRRAERSLVIPNERQATPSGAVWDTTRRAWPVLRPSFVVSRLSSATTLRFFRLAGAQNRLKQDGQHSVNRP